MGLCHFPKYPDPLPPFLPVLVCSQEAEHWGRQHHKLSSGAGGHSLWAAPTREEGDRRKQGWGTYLLSPHRAAAACALDLRLQFLHLLIWEGLLVPCRDLRMVISLAGSTPWSASFPRSLH